MVVKTMSELLDALELLRDDIMEDEVSDDTIDIMQDNISTYVYDAYEPVDYVRTGKLQKDILSTYTDGILTVVSDRHDTGVGGYNVYVSSIVEHGSGYLWGGGKLDKIIGPRRFGHETREDMKNGGFKGSFLRALHKRGYEAE